MRGVRLALSGTGLFLLASAVVTYHHAHYAAPFCAFAFLILTAAVRRLAVLADRRLGWHRAWVAALVLAVLLGEGLL